MEKFWKKFVEGDILVRNKQMKVIIDNIIKGDDLEDKKMRRFGLKTLMLGYFEDLITYMESRKWLIVNRIQRMIVTNVWIK